MSTRPAPVIEPISLTIKQAATVTGLSVDTLNRAINAGELRAKKSKKTPGHKRLVSPRDLRDWFEGLEDA